MSKTLLPSLVALGVSLHFLAQGQAVAAGWTTLDRVARAYEFQPPILERGRIVLRRGFDTVQFEAGSRRMVFNGVALYMNGSVVRHPDGWLIALPDVEDGLLALLNPCDVLRNASLRTVVLDPGHGGDDPGARDGWRLDEKRLTLDIARRVRRKLRAFGVDAQLTRDRDMTVSLDARWRYAERLRAGLLVSIHLNASRDRRISGVETFVVPAQGFVPTADREGRVSKTEQVAYPANHYDGANAVLGYYLHKGLLAYSRGEDRGIRRARFQVIKNARCPSALVECGFLSNRREAELLAEDGYRESLAEGITRGILTYLSRVREASLPQMPGPVRVQERAS